MTGQDDKVRVVLNKCDSVDPQQLMRVHGALMWSLGKCIGTPEVVRVYLGSFWDKPINPIVSAPTVPECVGMAGAIERNSI